MIIRQTSMDSNEPWNKNLGLEKEKEWKT